MNKRFLLSALAVLLSATGLYSQQPPEMPAPAKEHKWLQQFVGDWETEVEVFMDPKQPPMKGKGTETTKSLGGFWVVGEGQSEMMGMKFGSVLTLGYDVAKQKFIGTWVDSMASHLWQYEGSLDASGKVLTLDTQGPCPLRGGKTCKFKEVTEIKDQDHRVFTSSLVEDDGRLTQLVRVTSKRKK